MQSTQAFAVRDIQGQVDGFNVRLRLTPAQKLQIYLQNHISYENYFVIIKPDDIKRENLKNHCDFIQTACELFQYIQFSLSESVPFEEVFKVDGKGKVTVRLQMKIDFKQGSKKKVISYEFQTAKQNINSLDKLRGQVNSLTSSKEKFQKDILRIVEAVVAENKKLQKQVETLSKTAHSSQLIKYCSSKEKLIVKGDTLLQSENKTNVVLIGELLDGQSVQEWKVRICCKMVLTFGVASQELTKLQSTALDDAIGKGKYLVKQYFSGGEILTCTFEGGEFKYTIEKVEIEEEEGCPPEVNYNMRRGSFLCKNLTRVDNFYACLGLHFGARVEVLGVWGRR